MTSIGKHFIGSVWCAGGSTSTSSRAVIDKRRLGDAAEEAASLDGSINGGMSGFEGGHPVNLVALLHTVIQGRRRVPLLLISGTLWHSLSL